jgi:transcriptional regulator of arginine metabolism
VLGPIAGGDRQDAGSVDHTARRTRKIREIVGREVVATQAALVAALRRHGVRVTQATVSRDIKRLGLVKVPVGEGRSRYALPGAAPAAPSPSPSHVRSVFAEFVTDVDTAVDLVLVKTEPGGAQPVAQAIDDMRWPDIAGTLAGEDTIIVVPRRRAVVRAVFSRLRQLAP